jgi:hypothetical protein
MYYMPCPHPSTWIQILYSEFNVVGKIRALNAEEASIIISWFWGSHNNGWLRSIVFKLSVLTYFILSIIK